MQEALKQFCEEKAIGYSQNEPMSRHTSFRIGGKADLFFTVDSLEKTVALIEKLKELSIPFFVIGNGSNLLVSDEGIEGAVIRLSDLSDIKVSGEQIVCGAGATLSAVCCAARDHGLTGLEFAYGIPGTAGGALTMNAGAYGGEMKDAVKSATVLFADGVVREVPAKEMALSYRESIFKKNGAVILRVTLSLSKGDQKEIDRKMKDLAARRREKQPLDLPSAGSTFKRPEGYFAGALIEKNGLKGFRVGDAAVSEKHAGFVVNLGNATAADVLAVIEKVQQTVKAADGVWLEPEVLFVGREKQ